MTLAEVDHPDERTRVLAFIRGGFSEHFGATANIDPPRLLALRTPTGEIAGAVGLRSVTDGWFSTRYLDTPIDTQLTTLTGQPVNLATVIEVVHLAVSGPAMVSPLLDELAIFLYDAGYRFTLCTVTRCLRRLFQRRGWNVTALAEARPAALGDSAPAWGRYYEEQPVVVVGDLAAARQLAAARFDGVTR